MQIKHFKRGFSHTMSGHLNAKNNQASKKLLDLQDFDVQMLSPDFLSSKTLKKPFKQLPISLTKTNPHGIRSQIPAQKEHTSSLTFQNKSPAQNRKQIRQQQFQKPQYNYVSCQNLNIRPAFRPNAIDRVSDSIPQMQLQFKDKNSIISALSRKGQLNPAANFQIKIIEASKPTNSIGPAEAKLKSLFNKKDHPLALETTKKKGKEAVNSELDIDEQINQSIEQEYANQSFQKVSGAYESQIKESIRESIIGSSGHAKGSINESIRESIRDEIPESFRSVISKQKQSVKEEIIQSHRKQSIEEEVYEQIFEQASLSDELSRSKNNKFKKQKEEDKIDLSASASKKFRTKTNTISKSIRFAQELAIHNEAKNADLKIQQKYEKGDKLAEQIIKQKASLAHLHHKISAMLDSSSQSKKQMRDKNLDLFHKFRIQINRLITSDNFLSKIRRLTAFLGTTSSKSGELVSKLQDQLLNNILGKIQDMRVSGVDQAQLAKMRQEYDQKINCLLKQQEMSLRVEMDRKLHQKDLEVKKMIAMLERNFNSSAPTFSSNRENVPKPVYGDRAEVDSDYSIESDQVSWKMDLWEVLPDYEKKKLYEKQGVQISKFLTEALMAEIKNEALDRSADISFEFPDQFNSSGLYSTQSRPQEEKKTANGQPFTLPTQKKQTGRLSSEKSEIFPPLPGVKKVSNMRQQHFENNIHYLQMPLGKVAENESRETKPASEVVKMLSKYKNLFLKKKNDLIRMLIKILQSKQNEAKPLSGLINEIRIVNQKQISESEEPYVKAYQEDIIMELVAIFNKSKNRKNSVIQEEMKKMYDRIVVTSQVKTAQSSVKSPNQITPSEIYIDLRMSQEDKKVKEAIVQQICNILAAEFAKQMPHRRK